MKHGTVFANSAREASRLQDHTHPIPPSASLQSRAKTSGHKRRPPSRCRRNGARGTPKFKEDGELPSWWHGTCTSGEAENPDLPSPWISTTEVVGRGAQRRLALPQARPRRPRMTLAEPQFLLSGEAKSESTFPLSDLAWRPGSSLARVMTPLPMDRHP